MRRDFTNNKTRVTASKFSRKSRSCCNWTEKPAPFSFGRENHLALEFHQKLYYKSDHYQQGCIITECQLFHVSKRRKDFSQFENHLTNMQIIPAAEKKVFKEFLEFPKDLYKNDPYWIPYSAFDVKNLFDPQKNRFFKHGCCNKWMLVDGSGKAIGRIAAFINSEKLNGAHLSVGGIGFFECINDNDCAHLLFNVAKEWLWQNDMQAMDGPINMGENLNYWGLLVDGFKSPSLGMNYNFPYYEKLFDSYGFIKLYDQYTNLLDATVPMPERFAKIADRVMSNPKYTFRHIDKTHFNQFAKDFQEIYNDAWTDFENFTPIEMDTIVETFRQMKPILDEKIIWYAYCNQEPIACVICLPDVNRILRRLDSHFDWFNKIKFVWYKKTIVIDRLRIILMGCKKKFQNHGIESALIRCLQCEVLPRQKIREVELAWVGDFNNKMMAIHQATGAKKDKVHRTYRYFFDRTPQ